MSLISQLILNADDQLRYLTLGELDSIVRFISIFKSIQKIISTLRNKETEIIRLASKKIFQIHPEYIAPGGNAAGAKQRSLCLRDYGWYLRLITYGIIAGDQTPIEKIGIIGVKEMYNSLGVPIIGMVDSIKCLKNATLEILDYDQESFRLPYFDYLIRAIDE
uniref:Allophycocyanin gamma subunit n=1 Tax=Bulboplastis apyrenoidosa TaxID=1070855 RepID=A0A1Y9TMH1_9RHOD|nr:allophycocyanin gamma subunit [Bulboplastis apyrenoidosa]ARO90850.1 allophycocyanin gamma subunit [Bulboplastis apyrenoidosa]